MGNKISKLFKKSFKKKTNRRTAKFLCQECEEHKLYNEFQKAYWGLVGEDDEESVKDINPCKNYNCIRYKK